MDKNAKVMQIAAAVAALGILPSEDQQKMLFAAWSAAPGLQIESQFPEKLNSDMNCHGWRALLAYPALMRNARSMTQLISGAGSVSFPAVKDYDVLAPAIRFAFTADTENNLIKFRVDVDVTVYTDQGSPPSTTVLSSYWDGSLVKGSGSMSQRYLKFDFWNERYQYNDMTSTRITLQQLAAYPAVIRDEGSRDVQVGDVKSIKITITTTNSALQTGINLVTPGSEDFDDYASLYMAGQSAQFINELISRQPELVPALNIPVALTTDGRQIVNLKPIMRTGGLK